MSTSQQLLTDLRAALPEPLHLLLDQAVDRLPAEGAVLRVVLVGAFSVGKSSLLNMLLGEQLLQAALEETTALPTFIEYGSSRTLQLLQQDGSQLLLDEAGFAHATTHPPEGAACAVVNVSLDWLNGVSIIDLPGLGSVSDQNHAYTHAQIDQADAVLYLIAPRGPAGADLGILKHIAQTGKRVKVMVTRWDEVEASVRHGEKEPSLSNWADQIEAGAGLRVRLAPCSQAGLGRDDVLDFIARAKEDIGAIRHRRLCQEVMPLLENAMGENTQLQRSCEVESEQAVAALHAELMQSKQALSAFKNSLHQQQQQDRASTEQQAEGVIRKQRLSLGGALKMHGQALTCADEWGEFGAQGAALVRDSLVQTAQALSELSSQYGGLTLPPAQVAEFNLRLPTPEPIDINELLDMGKLTLLQESLQDKQAEFAAAQQRLQTMPEQDPSTTELELRALLQEREHIANQPLPRIVQRVSEGGSGAAMGRFFGEMADIGLMFLNPVTVGAKAAALLGKGAKVAKVASTVGKTVSTTVKVAQGVQTGHRVRGVAPVVMDKLAKLEVLSLGYWGERMGSSFGSQPQDEEVVDPQAQAEQAQAMAVLDERTQQLRRALHRQEDMANERQLVGIALLENRKEQTRLQAELSRVQQAVERQRQQVQAQLNDERMKQMERHASRAIAQWLRNFEQQSAGMSQLLHARIKTHWEDRVDALVAERLADMDVLLAQVNASPAEKQKALGALRTQASALQQASGLVAA